MVFDQGEGSDILDAIVAEGRCGTCGTPWDRIVNVGGKRPVKIEGGCPNDVCVLGDWRVPTPGSKPAAGVTYPTIRKACARARQTLTRGRR
jgi:hypothetical protein